MVIFITLEAVFFAFIFSNINLPPWMNEAVIPVLGIAVAVCFVFIFKRRGDREILVGAGGEALLSVH